MIRVEKPFSDSRGFRRGGVLPRPVNPYFETSTVGATLRGRPHQCASVTLDPVRDCAERKNFLPSAASSAHGQICSLHGFAAKIHFKAGASSFPQNALRWRFVGAICGLRRVPAKALLLWDIGRTDLKANFWHLPK